MRAQTQLSRRTLLRSAGLAGIAIALPRLEAMIEPRAAHAGTGPKRLVVFHWPQGLPVGWGAADDGFWYPTQEGTGWTMTPGLSPLSPFKEDINIVSGLTYEQVYQSVGSHGHACALFTGYKAEPETPGSSEPTSRGPSIDRIAGAKLGATTKFSSLATGLYDQGEGWWSWSDAGVRNPLELDPKVLFDKLFAGVDLDPSAAAEAAARQKSILDFVADDLSRLQKVVGTADRARLDEHLSAIRELEKQVTTPVSASCALPPEPTGVAYSDGECTEYARVMMDLCLMALRCDLTRVCLVSLGPSQNYRVFSNLSVPIDYHNVCHRGLADPGQDIHDSPEGQAEALGYYKDIATWHMEQLAYFLGGLKADDGAGNLLEDTAFVATSEFSGGGLHHYQFIPVIVAGKLGAMATGKNIVFPCQMTEDWKTPPWCGSKSGTPNVCINDLWQSALTAVGALGEGEKFGDPTLDTKPLPGLWV